MSEDDLAPTTFVAMPFGKKQGRSGRATINFDDVYERGIKPAAQAANLDLTRADEEGTGGIIQLPMFERLLLSDIVIADITRASANVFYELGIRHAARPRSTLLISAETDSVPFDIAPIRVIPYRLKSNGRLTDKAATALSSTLASILCSDAFRDEKYDSPLFQLIEKYPGIDLPHDVTDAFSVRSGEIIRLDEHIREIGRSQQPLEQRVGQLNAIADKALKSGDWAERPLLISLLLAYRDSEAWTPMITLIDNLPPNLQGNRTIQEQLAFGLNRRNGAQDRRRAIKTLNTLLEAGTSVETLSLLGRIYKDKYIEANHAHNPNAIIELKKAIGSYTKAFREEPRDYYPGINAATLNLVMGTNQSLKRMDKLLGLIAFAVARRGALKSENYWDVATVLELATLRRSRKAARRAAARAIEFPGASWQIKTTVQNLQLVDESWTRLGRPLSWLPEVVSVLEGGAVS